MLGSVILKFTVLKLIFFHLKYPFSLLFGAMTTMLSRVAKTLSPDPGYTPDHIGVSAQLNKLSGFKQEAEKSDIQCAAQV
jgi:hypothetical protein